MKIGPVELQRQPTGDTCVVTCLAMALCVPVETILPHFGSRAGSLSMRDIIRTLEICEVDYQPFILPRLSVNGWYFAVVPSLNIPGGMHQVLLHFDTGALHVFDPNPEGKNRYDFEARNLRSWAELIYFHPGGKPGNLTSTSPTP